MAACDNYYTQTCTPPEVPAGAVVITTDAELDAFINDHENSDLAGVADLTNFSGREIAISGYTGPGLEFYGGTIVYNGTNPKGGSAALRVWSSRNVHFYGTQTFGGQWGVVFGQSFSTDTRSGAVQDSSFQYGSIASTEQSTLKISADGTARILIRCNTIRDAGTDLTKPDFGELVYIGEGSDELGVTVTDIDIIGNNIFNGTSDLVDIKPGAQRVNVVGNLIHGGRQRFGGLVTVGASDTDPGFTGDHYIGHNVIYDGAPTADAFTQAIDGIEIGTSAVVERNVIYGVTGYGIRLVRQFADSGKIVRANNNTIHADLGAYGINNEAPNGGNNPGTLVACGNAYLGNHYDDDGLNGSTFNDAEAFTSDFVTVNQPDGYTLRESSPLIDTAPGCVAADPCVEDGLPDYGACERTLIRPVAVPDAYTFTVGDTVYSDLLANDTTGTAPITVTTSGQLPPGTMHNAGEISGTATTPGTYTITYTIVDANNQTSTTTASFTIEPAPTTDPNTGDCKQIALYFVTLPEGVTSLADCPELPCIVDENGAPYDIGFDVDGNSCLVIPNPNPVKPPATYVSGDGEVPPAVCCLTNFDIGTPAYDETGECVTHICMGENLGWQPFCGQTEDPVDPPVDPPDPDDPDTTDRVCYDMTGRLPATYGGQGATWLVSTIDQLANIDCPTGAATATPSDTLWTCDYTSYSTPDSASNIAGYNLTSTGGTNVDGTGINCGGGVNRPTFITEFDGVTGSGPVTVNYNVTQGDGMIVFAAYNNCTGQYEPIGNVNGPNGMTYSINGSTVAMDTATGTGPFTVDLADNNLDPACVDLVWFSINGGGSEVIDDISLAFTAAGASDCCNTAGTSADVAALLTAEDPAGNVWTTDGNLVCSDMPLGQGSSYGNLTFCDGTPTAPSVVSF